MSDREAFRNQSVHVRASRGGGGGRWGSTRAREEEGADEEEDRKKRTESPLLIHPKHFSEDALVRRRSVL